MIALTILTALSIQAAQPDNLLLPGVLDLPVLEGSQRDPSCGGQIDAINPGDGLACVSSPSPSSSEGIMAYAESALGLGWRPAFLAQESIFLERSKTDGRCELLAISASAGGEPSSSIEDPNIISIILERDMQCVRPDVP